MKIVLILLLFTNLVACSQKQKTKKYVPDPKAKHLADSAALLTIRSGNVEKAIALLDEATQIDSNYYLAFANKLSYQFSLNQLDDALLTAKNMIRIKPQIPDPYVATGIVYWKSGDSASAMDHFTKATVLLDKILDTMSTSNKAYETALMNQAFNLILIGEQEKANKIITEIFNKQTDDAAKQMLAELLKKSRKEILDDLAKPDSSDESGVIIRNEQPVPLR